MMQLYHINIFGKHVKMKINLQQYKLLIQSINST